MTVYLNLENYMMFTYTSLALASEISQKLNYSIIINLVKITITHTAFISATYVTTDPGSPANSYFALKGSVFQTVKLHCKIWIWTNH